MKTVLVFSGGMDSSTLLYDLMAQGDTVECVTVNYKQRHAVEIKQAEKICRKAGVKQTVVDLSSVGEFLKGSSQTDESVRVPFGNYDEPSMKITVVPNRNMFLLAVAGAYAIAQKADRLAYGAHAGDHAIYPDCRPEFVAGMQAVFQIADWHKLSLYAPYLHMSKGEICKVGLKLGVPYELTWTCYQGLEAPCGKCGACVERDEAFQFCNARDPLFKWQGSK